MVVKKKEKGSALDGEELASNLADQVRARQSTSQGMFMTGKVAKLCSRVKVLANVIETVEARVHRA